MPEQKNKRGEFTLALQIIAESFASRAKKEQPLNESPCWYVVTLELLRFEGQIECLPPS